VSCGGERGHVIWTSIYDNYLASMKFTAHLDHICHCKTASGANWSNRLTYQAFIIENSPRLDPPRSWGETVLRRALIQGS
jgi:hypothetical protein